MAVAMITVSSEGELCHLDHLTRVGSWEPPTVYMSC